MKGRGGEARGLLVVGIGGAALLAWAAAGAGRGTVSPASGRARTGAQAVSLERLPPPRGSAAAADGVKSRPPLPAGAASEASAELLIFLAPGTDPETYARQEGLRLKHSLRGDPDAHVFEMTDPQGGAGAVARARRHAKVRRAYVNERLARVRCPFVPNDPFYPSGSPVGFPGQWHLVNANVVPAWNRDVTGLGVVIGIVDDGLQTAHPDLAANYAAADSYDFGQNDPDPNPFNLSGSNEDRHGTAVAGVAAARGGNGVGVTGAAPHAGLAGLRINFAAQTIAMFVDATLYHSSGSNTNVKVKNHSYGFTAPFVEVQAERDAAETSAASGTIHCFAAGNERGKVAQDSNKQDVQSSPSVVAVAALGSDGRFASYSSFGGNVFVTAPSSSSTGLLRITTTDRTGGDGYNRTSGGGDGDPFPNRDYTSTFTGTSSASPLAAGILALVKQVQAGLDVRFAKHLLARASALVDSGDNTLEGDGDGSTTGSAWHTNAAGFRFNQNYGFGRIDADALTQQALLYSGVTPLQTVATGTVAVGAPIPDNDLVGVTRTFVLAPTTPLEEIMVTFAVTHTFRGDLEAFLTSPSGTTSRVFFRSGSDGTANLAWTFVSNAFWGESPAGTWTLRLRDVFGVDSGTWTEFAVTARMGQPILNATPPSVSSIARADADPANASAVTFAVTFTESVTGVDASDFAVTSGGAVGGAGVSGVTGSGSVYSVTVNTGAGDGTLRLDVLDDDTIQDVGGSPLGGAGAGNGAITTGPSYTVDKTPPVLTFVTSPNGDGAYGAGQGILVAVSFSEPATLTGGALQVTLSTGDVVAIAPFGPVASASGLFTVGPGDTSPDLNAASPLTLSGGTLRDAAGNDAALTIPAGQNLADLKNLVIDTTAPGIARVTSSTVNGTYGLAAAVGVTVEFTEPATLAGGSLQITLSTGDVVSIGAFGPAPSAAGSYTVGAGDNSGDLDSADPLTLSGGTLRDAAGNDATLTIPAGQSLGALKDLVVDTSAPAVTILQAAGQPDPASGGPILFTVTFSEPVGGFVGTDVALSGTAGATTAAVSGGPSIYTVSVSGMGSEGSVVATIPGGVAFDGAGNVNTSATSADNTVTYDPAAPTVTINQAAGQADPTNVSPVTFTVTFSESVAGFDANDLVLGGTAGATTAFVAGGPAIYTVQVSGMVGDGSVTATVQAGAAADSAGNVSAGSTSADNQVLYDVTAPAVTINQATGQSDPGNSPPILFTVVFNEAVTGFSGADVVLGGTAGATTAVVAGGPAVYTMEVSGMTVSGTVSASIPAGAAIDAVGNPNTASTSTDGTVTYNPIVPTVTINQAAGQADPTNASPVTFTVTFSEPVTGFDASDVSLAGSTAGGSLGVGVSGTGATYTVTVSGPASTGTVVATIPAGAAVNALLTASAASTSSDNEVTYDVTPPAVTVNRAVSQGDPTRLSPITFAVVFTEVVSGLDPSDLSFAGSTAGGPLAGTVGGGGTTYMVTVTGMTSSGTVALSISAGGASDAAGNVNTASTGSDTTVTYDVTPPGVTIDQAAAQADPTNGSPVLFTVVFSEPVTGFTAADVVLGGTAGATTAGVSGSGTTYSVSVNGMTSNGTVTASVPAGAASDTAGNSSSASASTDNVVTYDATAPTVTINQAAGQADPAAAGPVSFTVVFSEPVTGFDASDVSLAGSTTGGTLSPSVVTVNATTYTVNVTGMTGQGQVAASIPGAAASDAAGNAGVASSSSDNTVAFDAVAPSVTVNQAVGQPDPASGPSVAFTVVFSEPVTGFDLGDVDVGGTAGGTVSVTGSGATYTASVTGMATDGSVVVTVAAAGAHDAAGNGNTASTATDNTVTFDGTVPTVTLEQAAAQVDPTNTAPITFTVTFSEPVTGFTAVDVLVSGTAGGSAAVSGPGPVYTVTVSGMAGDGKVVVTIPAGAASDAAGNGNEASTSTDNSVTFDTTAPVVTTVSATNADGIYDAGEVIQVTVRFSEAVTVTGVPRLALETGAVDAVTDYSSGSGSETLLFLYTVAAGHESADLDTLSAAALTAAGATVRDAAGNDATLALPAPAAPGSLGANKNLVVDTTGPLAGTVEDGWSGPDVDVQSSVTTLSAHWSGFGDPQSGIAQFEWALGTSPGGEQVRPFASVGLQTAASTSALNLTLVLTPGSTYFVTVRVTNGVGLQAVASSDGVTVTTADVGPPSPPARVLAFPLSGGVLLEWLPSPSGDVAFYRAWVKPATASWSEAVLWDLLTGTFTTITGLANGAAYDILFRAVDGAGNESPGVLLSVTPRPSITIGGAGSYATIQDAVDAALPGQTVEVGPGVYSGPVVLAAGVSLCGTSPRHTVLVGVGAADAVTVLGAFLTDPRVTICDLTIRGGLVGVRVGTADVFLARVIVHHAGSHGVTSGSTGRLEAVNCTLMSNGGDGVQAAGSAILRNCISGRNAGMGIRVLPSVTFAYSDTFLNAAGDFFAGTAGPGTFSTTAVFTDEAADEYTEASSSPTIDAGHPADGFSKEPDPNGGRINVGAFGNTPWAASAAPPAPPAPSGGGGGGRDCGSLGVDGLLPAALLAFLRRRSLPRFRRRS